MYKYLVKVFFSRAPDGLLSYNEWIWKNFDENKAYIEEFWHDQVPSFF